MSNPTREASLAEAKEQYELYVKKQKELYPDDPVITFEEWLEETKLSEKL